MTAHIPKLFQGINIFNGSQVSNGLFNDLESGLYFSAGGFPCTAYAIAREDRTDKISGLINLTISIGPVSASENRP
jgi:hypothetical protein